MYRVVKPAKTSSAATPVAQSVRRLTVRQQWRREAGPGTIGACHPVLVRHRRRGERLPDPSPHRWVVAERRRPRTTQACMFSCVSKGRDRAHLSCAAVPSVSPGPYRRGRWLCWSCSSRRRPGRAPSLFPVSLVFLRDVTGIRERRWAPPCGCSLFSPCSLSTSQSPLVWFAPGCLSPSTHLYCFWWTSTRNCILAIFTAFPSCGVPAARWRDLRNVVLGICRK